METFIFYKLLWSHRRGYKKYTEINLILNPEWFPFSVLRLVAWEWLRHQRDWSRVCNDNDESLFTPIGHGPNSDQSRLFMRHRIVLARHDRWPTIWPQWRWTVVAWQASIYYKGWVTDIYPSGTFPPVSCTFVDLIGGWYMTSLTTTDDVIGSHSPLMNLAIMTSLATILDERFKRFLFFYFIYLFIFLNIRLFSNSMVMQAALAMARSLYLSLLCRCCIAIAVYNSGAAWWCQSCSLQFSSVQVIFHLKPLHVHVYRHYTLLVITNKHKWSRFDIKLTWSKIDNGTKYPLIKYLCLRCYWLSKMKEIFSKNKFVHPKREIKRWNEYEECDCIFTI